MFAELSRYINSLGDVRWSNMTNIARAHYFRMVDGNILRLKMQTKRAEVLIPDGIDSLAVERPWLQKGTKEPLFVGVLKDVYGNVASADNPGAAQ